MDHMFKTYIEIIKYSFGLFFNNISILKLSILVD